MDANNKHNFIVSVHTGARWVKLAWPSEPIFLNPTLLISALRATRAVLASRWQNYRLIMKLLIVFLRTVVLRNYREQIVQSSVSCDLTLYSKMMKSFEIGKSGGGFRLSKNGFLLSRNYNKKMVFDHDLTYTFATPHP